MLQKENNPWLGLASYTVDDAYRFFGREREMEVLKDAVCNNYITTVYGISGAGKTSLVNAGMCPLLNSGNYLPVSIRLEHGTNEGYATQIITAIEKAVADSGGEVEKLADFDLADINDAERLWTFLYTTTLWSATNHQLCPIVFIDQFEEIFTKNDEPEAIASFFETVSTLQNNNPPRQMAALLERQEGYVALKDEALYRLVLIMREDFLARLEDYSYNVPTLRKNRQGIRRMNGLQALEVVLRPMPGLVSRDVALQILGKVTGKEVQDSERFLERLSVDTSILSLFCSELYLRAAESKADTISEELVNQFGGNIISTFYENTMKLVSAKTMEYLEDQLLTKSGYRDTVAWDDMKADGIKRDELSLLADKRLIRIETHEGLERVEFTHDVLCQVAKDHRDRRSEKSARSSKRLRHWQFAIESTFIVGLALLLPYYLYYWGFTGLLKSPSYWLLPAAILFLGLVVSPYRHTKDKNAIWTTLLAWGGSYVLFGIMRSTAFEALTDKESVIFMIYLIYQVFFIGVWRHKRQRSRREALVYCLKCRVYDEYPFFKRWLAGLGVVAALAMARLIGYPMNDLLSIVGGTALTVAVLWLLPHCLPPYDMEWGWKRAPFLTMAVSVAVVFAFQYVPFGWFLIYSILGLVGMWLFVYFIYIRRTHLKQNPQYKMKSIAWTVMKAGIVLFILRTVIFRSMGYSPIIQSNNQYARVWKHTIRAGTPYTRFITVRNTDGQMGVVDRHSQLVVPMEYDSIARKAHLTLDFERPWWLSLIGISKYSYYEENADLTFRVWKNHEEKVWSCADHLDMQNSVTRALIAAYKENANYTYDTEYAPKYFAYLQKAKPTEEAQDIIEEMLAKKFYDRLDFDSLLEFRRSVKQIEYNRFASALSDIAPLLPYDTWGHLSSFLLDTAYHQCKGQPETPSEQAQHLNNLSYYKILTRQFEQARQEAEKALEKDPTYDIAYTNLIMSNYLTGNYEKAFDLLKAKKDKVYARSVDEDGDTSYQYVGQGVAEDIQLYVETGVLTDTLAAEYKQLHTLIANYESLPPYRSMIYQYGTDGVYTCFQYTPQRNWDSEKEEYVWTRSGYQYLYYVKEGRMLSPLIVNSARPDNSPTDYSILIEQGTYQRRYYRLQGDSLQILPGHFDHAWQFSEGLAAVVVNDSISFINEQGETAIPVRFPYVCRFDSHDQMFFDCQYSHDYGGIDDYVDIVFHDGYCPIVAAPGRHGLIDRQGRWALEPEYEYINHPLLGYRIVKKNGRYGLMDRQLNLVLPIQFDNMSIDTNDETILLNDTWYAMSELRSFIKKYKEMAADQ